MVMTNIRIPSLELILISLAHLDMPWILIIHLFLSKIEEELISSNTYLSILVKVCMVCMIILVKGIIYQNFNLKT
jgi:hypothetical protein